MDGGGPSPLTKLENNIMERRSCARANPASRTWKHNINIFISEDHDMDMMQEISGNVITKIIKTSYRARRD